MVKKKSSWESGTVSSVTPRTDRQTDSRSQTGESRAGGRCEMWERDTKSRGAVRRKEG